MEGKNKVEFKSFLGMEVRVVNNEMDFNSGIYIIEFNCNKYKIGSTNNFSNRILSYKPYSFMISNITLLKCLNPYEMEKKLLKNIQDCKFYGEEWFEGVPDYRNIYKTFNQYSKDKTIVKNNTTLKNYKKVDYLNLIYPNKKIEEFEYVLEIMYKTSICLKNTNNNIVEFRKFYYDCSKNLKMRICNIIINNKIELKVLIDLIDIYFSGKFKLGKFLILEELLEQLKIFQPQTTVDLLEVREFVLDKFVNAYEFTGSHKTAREMTIALAIKKYKLNNDLTNKTNII